MLANATQLADDFDADVTALVPPPQPVKPARSGFGTTVLPEVDRSSPHPRFLPRSEDRFVPLGSLGEGGLGEVVAAFDNDIGRKVAVKRIRADRLSDGVMIRFLQEIQTVGKLEHANIIPIHDVGRDENGALYFVMRYVDGETLESVIGKLAAGDKAYHRKYGFERRLQIIGAVLEALAYAHANGVVHRDIKPANVMIGRYGEVLLLDWGIARLVDAAEHVVDGDAPSGRGKDTAGHTRAGAILGTPAYMAPEQALGKPADARSDLYALSVMAHELMTLQHYLADCESAESMLIQVPTRSHAMPSTMSSRLQDPVPADIGWLLMPGLEKLPSNRYASADAMLERIARRAEGEIEVQCPMTLTMVASSKGTRFFARHKLAVLGAAALTLVTLGVGAVTVGGGVLGLIVALVATS